MKKYCELFLKYWKKYREPITYLFFGVVTTLVNFVVYFVLTHFGMSTGVANIIAWAASVATAYVTNRLWVFESKAKGKEALREIASFVGCRVGTGVMDEIFMIAGVDWLGPMLVAPARMRIWEVGVKIFSNILVIVLNYVFSKIFIFKKRKED